MVMQKSYRFFTMQSQQTVAGHGIVLYGNLSPKQHEFYSDVNLITTG